MNKVISYLKQFSKKEKKGKQPKVNETKKTTVNLVVYGCLIVFFLIGLVGSLRASSLSGKVDKLETTVKNYQKNQFSSENTTDFDVSKVQYYMNNFVYDYINYSTDTADDRLKKLKSYYSFPVDKLVDDVKQDRVLKTQRLISVEKEDNHYLALMKIGYDSSGHSYQINLAIPFQMKDGLLAIVSVPYSLSDDLYQGKSKAYEKKNANDVTQLDSKTVASIKEFLPIFFDKYAASNETDLSLLMKTPVLMGGNFVVSKIDDANAVYYQDGKNKVVQISVDFKDTVTGSIHTEDFTFYLVKQKNGWYVNDLYHYFK